MKYKLGLALSGGGARGFAHLGVFKFLEDCGMKPDIISGTSAGALMGALYADGYSVEEIKGLFSGREFSDFAQLQIPKSGVFDSQRFRSFLRRHLRAKAIEDLKIPMAIVATDLDNGESRTFRSGPLVDVITASCSIPIIFSPVVINGVHYVDGGLFRNFPVSVIREECERVIGVNETEKAAAFKTFDLENVDRLVMIGYDASLRSFEKAIREKKCDWQIKSIVSRKNRALSVENEEKGKYYEKND